MQQGFKIQKSWYTFFRARNNIFAYTIVHLTFRAPQIVIRTCMYTTMYLAVHLLQRQKYFRAEVNLRSIPLTMNLEPSLGIQTVYYRERDNNIFSDISLDNIFFWVTEKKKELSPSQMLYYKLEKYLPLSIYKNIYFIHIRLRFFNGK